MERDESWVMARFSSVKRILIQLSKHSWGPERNSGNEPNSSFLKEFSLYEKLQKTVESWKVHDVTLSILWKNTENFHFLLILRIQKIKKKITRQLLQKKMVRSQPRQHHFILLVSFLKKSQMKNSISRFMWGLAHSRELILLIFVNIIYMQKLSK